LHVQPGVSHSLSSSIAAAAGKHASLHWLFSLGWLGVFGAALLDSSPIPLPVPGTTDLLILLLVVHKSSPWLVVSVAVVGSVIGGFLTWSAGKKGGEVALARYMPRRFARPIQGWVRAHGAVAVALSAVLPPPVPLMPFLAAAGALGVPLRRFLISFTTARTTRYALVAWLGRHYGRQMVHWWNRYLAQYSTAIGWCILALFLAGFGWAVWKWRHQAKSAPQPRLAASS
jgi:membrane protein YqaA with SNARE-associated domain